ncbi:O-antigen polymerase [Mucilaginibacter sp. Mucisp86]|uniref:O-antigen polymerase n=1 Tax=Mucilaginibacter sp. Mucisp86 TaxID=3243060 RepID=UPI0039B45666
MLTSVAICLSLSLFTLGTYLVWPSRYNVPAHLGVGFILIAYVVPTFILDIQDDSPAEVVDLYVNILVVGTIFYLIGLFAGFLAKLPTARFSFNVLSLEEYESRIIKITRNFLICGIGGLILGYLMMGFVPMFAADPVSAKFFRGPYQVPFYTSIVYLSSFFILSNITPISFMIWYKHRNKSIFLFLTIIAVILMMLSLSRGPAFTGVLTAIIIIMSFKSRSSFAILLLLIVFIYLFSSIFYYLIGIKDINDIAGGFDKTDHLIWRVMAAGTNDIYDQLNFLTYFENKPEWTYGRTVFGGLVPSHYEWNPSVYTLKVVNPGKDLSELISGGLRLPGPVWGYVSFQWTGVITFSFLSGFIKGAFLKYLKTWMEKHKSILTSTVLIVISMAIFEPLSSFYTLSIYLLPTLFLLMFYAYRFRLK